MSVYMSEEEQVEMLKSWWKKYSGIITICLSIILLITAGVRYWNWHITSSTQQASAIYERMMLAYANKDFKEVRSNSQRLIDDYKSTVYSDVAHLTLAKVAISHDKYDTAKNSLSVVINQSKSDVMVNVAKIRKSRILIEEKNYSAALAILNSIADKSLQAIVNELKGDIAMAQGNKNDAASYYKHAISEVDKSGTGNLFLEMKTAQLFSTDKLRTALS